jgi:iron(III) transport system substrate-binding protein
MTSISTATSLVGPAPATRRQLLRRSIVMGLTLSGIGNLLAACSSPAPQAAPTSPPAPPAAPTIAPATTAAAARPTSLDQIVEGARREGQLNWADVTVQQSGEDRFHTAFRKKYGLPDSFQITHTFKDSGTLITQVQQEVQADKVMLDFALIGDLDFWKGLDQAGALLDYAPAELGALEPVLQKMGLPSHSPRWVGVTAGAWVPVWNKKYVTKDIRSWNDLIDPAFADKAIQGDARTSPGLTDTYIGLRKALGVEFFQKCADTVRPVLITRTEEQQQKLTSGEEILSDLHMGARALQAQREDDSLHFGAVYPPEGVVVLPQQQGILARAAHPNAAKLMSEFMLSREGQQLWLDAQLRWPLRTDVTYSDEIKPFLPPIDQTNAVKIDWDAITSSARDEARAEFKRIFRVG